MRTPRSERGWFEVISKLTTEFLIKQLDKKQNELSRITQDKLDSVSGGTADSLAEQDRSQSDRS